MASYSCSSAEYADVLSLVGSSNSAAANAVCSTYDVASLGATGATVAYTYSQVTGVEADLGETKYGLNTLMIVLGAYGVFAMQIGFATFVAGAVRSKNIASVLLKSTVDTGVTAIMWYTVGYAFQAGGGDAGGFIGSQYFALDGIVTRPYGWANVVWTWVFCAASTTIMAGAVAERCTFFAYILFAAFYSGWVYPVFAHWTWSAYGWLSVENSDAILGIGAIDVAGSGVVHVQGGFAALVGSIVLGPRIGRWNPDSERFYTTGQNSSLYLMGTFLLWFGWFPFNSVSLQRIDNVAYANLVGRTAVVTFLGASASGIATAIIVYYRTRTWNMLEICNGLLGGLVSITCGCSVVEPWAAIICGMFAAPCVVYGELLLHKLQIDDPASSFAIHGLSGLWGMIFVGLLGRQEYILEAYGHAGREANTATMGLFYGGHGQLLLCQFISVLCNVAWPVFWMYPFFTVLNHFKLLRVNLEAEAMGLDAQQMGQANRESELIMSAKIGGGGGRNGVGNGMGNGVPGMGRGVMTASFRDTEP